MSDTQAALVPGEDLPPPSTGSGARSKSILIVAGVVVVVLVAAIGVSIGLRGPNGSSLSGTSSCTNPPSTQNPAEQGFAYGEPIFHGVKLTSKEGGLEVTWTLQEPVVHNPTDAVIVFQVSIFKKQGPINDAKRLQLLASNIGNGWHVGVRNYNPLLPRDPYSNNMSVSKPVISGSELSVFFPASDLGSFSVAQPFWWGAEQGNDEIPTNPALAPAAKGGDVACPNPSEGWDGAAPNWSANDLVKFPGGTSNGS
jgi:hypothetical protein